MNYYNDIDSFSCAWLRELIADGLIPNGDVDERSIADVRPEDLRGYVQCHFFAGIGGWSRALELAGWPATRPVWTGSCPCQPYSVAGKGGGFSDERDLWPHFYRLIRECRPDTIFGEQVEGAIGHGWLDRLCRDLEAEGYTVGSVVLGAHSVGAPHIRQRLYWVAHTAGERRGGRCEGAQAGDGLPLQTAGHVNVGGVADTEEAECEHAECTRDGRSGTATGGRVGDATVGEGDGRRPGIMASATRAGRSGDDAADVAGSDVGMEHSNGTGREEQCGAEPVGTEQRSVERAGFWDNSILIPCRDGKARRVERSIQPLSYGLPGGMVSSGDPSVEEANNTSEARVARLKGYGNAIVPQVACEFIRAYMEVE